jgi:hypothetical protein
MVASREFALRKAKSFRPVVQCQIWRWQSKLQAALRGLADCQRTRRGLPSPSHDLRVGCYDGVLGRRSPFNAVIEFEKTRNLLCRFGAATSRSGRECSPRCNASLRRCDLEISLRG